MSHGQTLEYIHNWSITYGKMLYMYDIKCFSFIVDDLICNVQRETETYTERERERERGILVLYRKCYIQISNDYVK